MWCVYTGAYICVIVNLVWCVYTGVYICVVCLYWCIICVIGECKVFMNQYMACLKKFNYDNADCRVES